MADPVVSLSVALGRRYTIQRELGRGGMGTVYLALDRRHDRQVALKVLPPDLADAVGPERFLREIGIVARLSHPNILPLYDSGRASGLLYYVLPYIVGGSLADRLRQEPPLTVPEAVAVAREIADALAHAHAHGVIHRDVKPDNILLHEGHALLADFGVARSAGDGVRTDSGLAVGTAAYASPEQAAGGRGLDERSDVYGLGCVLYEMLAGPAPQGRELLARRFTEPLPSLTTLRADVPAWVNVVVARALAGHPDQRYPTALAFRDALTTPAADPLPVPARPRRVSWMLAGATALAVTGAALAFLPGRFYHADSRQVVVAGFENKTGDPRLGPVGDIAIDYIARGLAATRLLHEVYDARATALEAGQPVRVGVAAGRELARRLGAGTVLGGSYYRDGDSLHFEAQLVDAASGRLILALDPVVGPVREQTRVVESLRQRVMGGFAVVFQSTFEDWQAASIPPSYQAYQEMLAASDDLWIFKPDLAVRHLRQAILEDSTYLGAKALLAYALAGLQECRAVDSVAAALARTGARLPPADQGSVSYAQAACRHDVWGKFEAAKTVLASAPRSVGFTVLAGIDAIELSLPGQGLAILRRFDAATAPLSSQQRTVYWSFVSYAYHDLGQYDRELEAAQRMGSEMAVETVRALAGRGDTAAVRRLVTAWLDASHGTEPALQRAQCAALELRAHGAAAAGDALLDRVVALRGPEQAAESGDEPCLWNLFSAHYYAGRLDEAHAAYAKAAAKDSGAVKAHAALAMIAARRGDAAELARQRRWLAAHPGAVASHAFASIEALSGRRDQAVEWLRRALDASLERNFLHIDPDLASLRDYPPYRELVRVRG